VAESKQLRRTQLLLTSLIPQMQGISKAAFSPEERGTGEKREPELKLEW
jgi:hypothetical protein